MEKAVHLEYLRGKYIQLSRQYLDELNNGKTIEQLKDLADVISTLIAEMEILENDDS
jgi:hypothetical protein